MKKAILVCRVFTVLSFIAFLVIMIVTANINMENWNNTVSMALRISLEIIKYCFVVSVIIQALLWYKIKEKKE